MKKKWISLGIVLLGLGSVFLAIVLGARDINFVYTLYLILSFASFAVAYFDAVGTTKLGFGITRFDSHKRLIHNSVLIIAVMLGLYLYAQTLIVLVYQEQSWLERIEVPMILFLSLLIYAHAQLGAFFGNIRIGKPLGLSVFIFLFVYTVLELFVITNKLWINIIYFLGSVVLTLLNHLIIKNIKIYRS